MSIECLFGKHCWLYISHNEHYHTDICRDCKRIRIIPVNATGDARKYELSLRASKMYRSHEQIQ